MKTWTKLFLTVVLGPSAFALLAVLYRLPTFTISAILPLPFTISFIAGGIVVWLFIPVYSFAAVLRHELAHALVAVLTFNRPVGLQVSPDGSGLAQYRGSGNWFISLAPYFLPLATLPVLLIGSFGVVQSYCYQLLLGVVAAFDLVIGFRQIGQHQTDFAPTGYGFGCFLCAAIGVLIWTPVFIFGWTLSMSQVVYVMGRTVAQLGDWGMFFWETIS